MFSEGDEWRRSGIPLTWSRSRRPIALSAEPRLQPTRRLPQALVALRDDAREGNEGVDLARELAVGHRHPLCLEPLGILMSVVEQRIEAGSDDHRGGLSMQV